MVLDGHNRWVACKRLGIPPSRKTSTGVTRGITSGASTAEQNGADFLAQLQSIEEEANRKRSEAAKEQPREPDGKMAGKPVVGHDDPLPDELPKEKTKRTADRHKGRGAKARAANVNSTTVKRGDVLANNRPDLASKVGLREKKS